MRSHLYGLIGLSLVTAQLGGCVISGSSSPVFSPDGKQVCYFREDRLAEPVVDGKIWSVSISLHVCPVNDPAKEYSVPITTLAGRVAGYWGESNAKFQWSPGSSRIGVLTPHGLTIIETPSGRKREIRDGTIGSFAWLSDGQVAYCTCRVKGNMQRLVICREDLGTQEKTDMVVFPQRPAVGDPWPPGHKEYWSPSGRFAILMEPTFHGQYHCIDVSAGSRRTFGETEAYDVGVAWRGDSGRAFCVSAKVGPEHRYEALLLDPHTGAAVDCTAAFHRTFGGTALPRVDPLFTVDGEYVIVNALGIGGHLVRPDSWEAVPLGQIAASGLNASKPPRSLPWLYWLPVPGWVGVAPTGNYGDSPGLFVADYSGRQVMPLPKGMPLNEPRAVSPDGISAATIGTDGRVKILKLDNLRALTDKAKGSAPAPGKRNQP